eukprot:gene11622-13728_t
MGQLLSVPELKGHIDELLAPAGYSFSYALSRKGLESGSSYAYCEPHGGASVGGIAGPLPAIVVQVILPEEVPEGSSLPATIEKESTFPPGKPTEEPPAPDSGGDVTLAQFLEELTADCIPLHDHTALTPADAEADPEEGECAAAEERIAVQELAKWLLAEVAGVSVESSTDPEQVTRIVHKAGSLMSGAHSNLVPVAGAVRSNEGILYVVYPAVASNLRSVMSFSPDALAGPSSSKEDLKVEAEGDDLNNLALDFFAGFFGAGTEGETNPPGERREAPRPVEGRPSLRREGSIHNGENLRKVAAGISSANAARSKATEAKAPLEWLHDMNVRNPCIPLALTTGAGRSDKGACFKTLEALVSSWRWGQISNLEYLLALNRMAGRLDGNRAFCTVLPWVLDMTQAPEDTMNVCFPNVDMDAAEEVDLAGWRDLRKTKWRLTKGDEQLDFTYSRSDIPHHVSDDCLSELAVCIYRARRLSPALLSRVVRTVFEPNEYPASMDRLYQWTPDECLPEFYTDSSIFYSTNE